MKNLIEEMKLKKLLKKEKKCNPIVVALIVVGIIAVIAAAAYAIYRYFAPQWFGEVEEDEDIFDEFEEDFFVDDEIINEDLMNPEEDIMFDE